MSGSEHRRARERSVVLAGHAADERAARAGLDDDEGRVRVAALGALARCGALTAEDLVTALTDPAAAVRRRAAEEAGRLGDRQVGSSLIEALADRDDTVVEAAAQALGELDPPPPAAVAAVAGLLSGHAEVVVRETAAAALGAMGDPGGLTAVLAATTDVATVRRRAVLALAAFEGDDVEEALRRLAEDRDRQVRQAAEDLLHGWGTPEA